MKFYPTRDQQTKCDECSKNGLNGNLIIMYDVERQKQSGDLKVCSALRYLNLNWQEDKCDYNQNVFTDSSLKQQSDTTHSFSGTQSYMSNILIFFRYQMATSSTTLHLQIFSAFPKMWCLSLMKVALCQAQK